MPNDAAAASDVRWAEAAELARGERETEGVRSRRRRWLRWTVLPTAIVECVLVVVIAVLLIAPPGGALATSHASNRADTAPFSLAGVCVIAVGVLTIIAGVVWGLRSRHIVARWRWISAPLSAAERRSALRQIRGTEPVAGERMAVLRGLADQNRRTSVGYVPLLSGFLLIVLGTVVFVGPDPTIRVDFALSVVVVVASFIALFVQHRNATRFLSRTQATG